MCMAISEALTPTLNPRASCGTRSARRIIYDVIHILCMCTAAGPDLREEPQHGDGVRALQHVQQAPPQQAPSHHSTCPTNLPQQAPSHQRPRLYHPQQRPSPQYTVLHLHSCPRILRFICIVALTSRGLFPEDYAILKVRATGRGRGRGRVRSRIRVPGGLRDPEGACTRAYSTSAYTQRAHLHNISAAA